MYTIPDELFKFVQDIITEEQPRSILEISGYDGAIGHKASSLQRVDRIDLSDGAAGIEDKIYTSIYPSDHLLDISGMYVYDVVLIFHLFENMEAGEARALLESLLLKIKNQILIITPIYPYDLEFDNKISEVRSYHPVVFLGLDFSYKLLETTDGILQAYSFFPKIKYPLLPCDSLSDEIGLSVSEKKMKIAYVIPYHTLTGCLKAMLQQMKEMKNNGHTIIAYFRSNTSKSAIPDWSHLTKDDISKQVVIPEKDKFLDYIEGVDLIFLGWMYQIPEFQHSVIPVVLWEQGSEMIYGDYKEMQNSKSLDRVALHTVFRMPVHLLAVSTTLVTVLKGVYNREAQLFPLNIDTEFYHPLEDKNNDIPVILLVGKPTLPFKGFEVALYVLEMVKNMGITFKLICAMPVDFTFPGISLEIEKYVEPTQEKLAELFRSADIYLSTSLYESFPLPPIEAMASGTAVVATDNGGINTYAKPGVNCILCEQGDLNSIVAALQYLLTNPDARKLLASEGRKTALKFSFDGIAAKLEHCLYKILENQSN